MMQPLQAHDLKLPYTASVHLQERVGIIYRLANQRFMQGLEMLHLLLVEAIEHLT